MFRRDTYNRADNFRPAGQRYSMYDALLAPEVGRTKESGVLLSTLNGRLTLRYAHYETAAANASINLPVQTLADNVVRTLDQIARGNNAENPAGIAAFMDWLNNTPQGQGYRKTFRLVQTTPDDWDYDRRTGQVTNTTGLVSKGDEYEIIVNPARNWRVAFNAAKAIAVRSNTGREFLDIMNSLMPVLNGPAGLLRQEDNGTQVGNGTRLNVLVPMLQVTSQDGAPTNELRRWHWNVVSNYRFTEGVLRGWNAGAAARWQDRVAIGFPVIVDPVAGPIPDVKHPYRGSAEINYVGWIGYSRKLWNQYNWSVQLNVKNIGRGDELIKVNTQPDGSINAWRIAEPQKWTLSSTISF